MDSKHSTEFIMIYFKNHGQSLLAYPISELQLIQ